MDKLEKFVDVEAEAKATVDHVKCCNCFARAGPRLNNSPKVSCFSKASMKKINICRSKCCIINFIRSKTKSFIRKITPE